MNPVANSVRQDYGDLVEKSKPDSRDNERCKCGSGKTWLKCCK